MIQTLFAKFVNYETVSYLIAGILTTIISIAVFAVCHRKLKWGTILSNIVSWILAVAFAFVVNKIFVFRSPSWEIAVLMKELAGFVSARLLTLGFDIVFVYITVDRLHWNDLISKTASNVVVMILNYIASKLFIFT
ncbi:MAG: GtrA family protein [Lachnospiraceae bacterium]|nr:GtrA family protein [Lachnospiraceae bacterium]